MGSFKIYIFIFFYFWFVFILYMHSRDENSEINIKKKTVKIMTTIGIIFTIIYTTGFVLYKKELKDKYNCSKNDKFSFLINEYKMDCDVSFYEDKPVYSYKKDNFYLNDKRSISSEITMTEEKPFNLAYHRDVLKKYISPYDESFYSYILEFSDNLSYMDIYDNDNRVHLKYDNERGRIDYYIYENVNKGKCISLTQANRDKEYDYHLLKLYFNMDFTYFNEKENHNLIEYCLIK